ncbi:MAG: hypothetical protein ACRECQ_04575, partial [Burkholderiaceae bacterium]
QAAREPAFATADSAGSREPHDSGEAKAGAAAACATGAGFFDSAHQHPRLDATIASSRTLSFRFNDPH